MEGADCEVASYNEREQAIIVHGDEGHITVVQPNEDGSCTGARLYATRLPV